jgi:hypothetical protein
MEGVFEKKTRLRLSMDYNRVIDEGLRIRTGSAGERVPGSMEKLQFNGTMFRASKGFACPCVGCVDQDDRHNNHDDNDRHNNHDDNPLYLYRRNPLNIINFYHVASSHQQTYDHLILGFHLITSVFVYTAVFASSCLLSYLP